VPCAPAVDRLPNLLGDLEPDLTTGLALPNGRTVDRITMSRYVLTLRLTTSQPRSLSSIATLKSARSRVRPASCRLRPNDPDVLRLQRWLRPDQLALVQGLRGAVTALVSLTAAWSFFRFFGEGRAYSCVEMVAPRSPSSSRADARGGELRSSPSDDANDGALTNGSGTPAAAPPSFSTERTRSRLPPRPGRLRRVSGPVG
jgi:hypothetical protein